MWFNINQRKKLSPLNNKKMYFSKMLIIKPRVKFKLKNDILLIKVNNNIALTLKKCNSVHINIKDQSLFFCSPNKQKLKVFIRNLLKFNSFSLFL